MRHLRNRGLTAIAFMAGIVLNFGIWRGSTGPSNYLALRDSRDLLKGTVSQLRDENGKLSAEILRLKQSPGYARKVLRDRYHVTEKDENIVFFSE